MGDSFRENAWDSQLDNMLDDLQNSVQVGESHGYKNGYGGPGQTTREYQERQNGNTREVRERMTRTAGGGPGDGFSYREESSFVSSSSSSHGPQTNMMGSKKAIQNGQMEQHMIDGQFLLSQSHSPSRPWFVSEQRGEPDTMRGRSDSLVSDLSSIAKVRSVSKSSTAFSSSERYTTEYHSSSNTSNTQQSIKKNINDLDNLLSNLSSHSAGPSRNSSKPASREGSPGRRSQPAGYASSSHVSRSEERRERLMSNASNYRSPSLGRTPSQSRPPSRPHSPALSHHRRTPEPSHHEFSSSNHQMTTSTMRSSASGLSSGSEFRPVHTTPDPLTGRYADGRITPNHGFTRNFHGTSPMPVRKATVPAPENGIPKKPDDLLYSLGHEVDHREIQRITQVTPASPISHQSVQHLSAGGNSHSEPAREGDEEVELSGGRGFHSHQECSRTTSVLSSR